MTDAELERELEALSSALHGPGRTPSQRELQRLYELTGALMRRRYGSSTDFNHCSVPAVSATVLRMAGAISPCPLLNVGMGGYPFVDMELTTRGFSVTGVEYSESLTALAREVAGYRGGEIRAVVADGAGLPFRNASFEACLCSETVEHVPDDRAIIRDIHRVLKPGGVLLLTVPCLLAFIGLGRRAVERLRSGRMTLHPTHLREYTYRSAKRLVDPYFIVERWAHVPFVTEPLWKMPYERLLSLLVRLPLMRQFSPSIAFVLRRRP
jgi:SAM-dependent methyltransferase